MSPARAGDGPCPLLVISPHFDDAALGCAALLSACPGARVATLFAACPERGAMSTAWDAACGFGSAVAAVQARREEDRAALACLGARPLWLEFCDLQYRQPATAGALCEAVLLQIEQHRPEQVAVPLGLFHPDHILAGRACIEALRRRPSAAPWLAYEDGLYRHLPGTVQRRLAALTDERITVTPQWAPPQNVQAKRAAVQAYASQLRALHDSGLDWRAEIEAPERYWLLQAEPAA